MIKEKELIKTHKARYKCRHPEKDTTISRLYYPFNKNEEGCVAAIDVYGIACTKCKEKYHDSQKL